MRQDININIHYTAPKEVWDAVGKVYSEMPKWIGYNNSIPYWYGTEDDCYIWASVEPSGIQFAGNVPQDEWDLWISLLKEKLTLVLGYPIGGQKMVSNSNIMSKDNLILAFS